MAASHACARVPTSVIGTGRHLLRPAPSQLAPSTWRRDALRSNPHVQRQRIASSTRPSVLAKVQCRLDSGKCTGEAQGGAEEREKEGAWGQGTLDLGRLAQQAAGSVVAVALTCALMGFPGEPALAADALKTCGCLLENCRGQLLRCLGDVKCAANIACLQACNGRPDETECQIGCGDLFANEVVDKFNACAITDNPCVPQKADDNRYPIPPDTALVQEFSVPSMEGPWYISAGQNPVFDTFDCQLHTFKPTGPRSFTVDITWRIRTPDGGFFTRKAVQDFVQPEEKPALLLNHDNEFLHYKDDWYVISSKVEGTPEDYFLVYYKGSNDAWDGYGGAVLYTRSKFVPPGIIPELTRASKAVGLDYNRFIVTDNTCPPPQPLLARLEKTVEKTVLEVEKKVENRVLEVERSVENRVLEVENKVLEAGKEELDLLRNLGKGLQELQRDKDLFLAKLSKEERELVTQMEGAKMGGAEDIEDLFGNSIPLRRPGR